MQVITKEQIKEQITQTESDRADAHRTIERCEGALTVLRHQLGKILRAEDEAVKSNGEEAATNEV